MNSSSTLIATVSINYEDFTEGFLTCGTCLYAYDQAEHTPKLLSCSHTICQSCLELIASSPTLNNSTETGCIKCPICRQNIAIPNGGITALPPSFLVNQLFDLVNKKPREFIPKCSVHLEQELLFCETCDCVFCDNCNNNNQPGAEANSAPNSLTTTTATSLTNTNISSNSSSASTRQQQTKQHINEVCTVIPFSTAIKRMSEIFNYRSQQCSSRLNEARDNVQKEIDKLESNCSDALRDIELAFETIKSIVDEREKTLLEEAKKLHEYKKNVLLEQLKTIEDQKSTLSMNNSVKINSEMDVKNLSKKISDLTEKNDSAQALFTPRENCFICFEEGNQDALDAMQSSVNDYGKIKTSKTYPPYCTSQLVRYSTHLRSTALVQSIDYNGCEQKIGGDPLQAELRLANSNELVDGEIEIIDKRDGTYEVAFNPPVPGGYQLYIYIFNRPIKNCPLVFETNSHHNPVAIYGQSSKKGVADQFDHFSQPACLTINKHNGRVFILDSFNNRIKILAQIDSPECPFSFMQHIQLDFLKRSCTGIALLYPEEDDQCDEYGIQALSLSPSKLPNPNILVTDWRNRIIYELNADGKLLRQYTHEELLEPTSIVVDSKGRIFVVDRASIFVFNSHGKLLHKLNGYKYNSTKVEQDTATMKNEMFAEPIKQPPRQLSNLAGNLLISGQLNQSDAGKENKAANNTATLNSYLIAAGNDKRSNIKLNTLSSLMSMKRKPKLNPSSSLQRGSKAVMSAASRIKSTFSLSHSTSLVSAASLQSMFNSNKHATINNQMNNLNQADSNSVNLGDNHGVNNTADKQKSLMNNKSHEDHRNQSNYDSIYQTRIKQTLPIGELYEGNDTSETSAITANNSTQRNNNEETTEPFGIIRGIAIGPEDELVIADESRVRVLELSANEGYIFKRELFVQGRQGAGLTSNHYTSGLSNASTGGRLCAMTYDTQSKKLLILYTCLNKTRAPFIQVVDYATGRHKFIIDSYDSKLIRPSSLATYGKHVIVSDLGNDCIKKYRFY